MLKLFCHPMLRYRGGGFHLAVGELYCIISQDERSGRWVAIASIGVGKWLIWLPTSSTPSERNPRAGYRSPEAARDAVERHVRKLCVALGGITGARHGSP